MRVELPIVGGAYEHRSLPVSAQTLKNWYVEVNPTKDQFSLQCTPGSIPFSQGIGFDRGMMVFQGELYKVSDDRLWHISPEGVQTDVGVISGANRCIFIADPFNMVIVSEGKTFNYDGVSVTDQTSANQETPSFVSYLNGQAIYDGDNGRFVVSDPGDLTTINALNFGTAESSGDALVRPFVFNELVYFFGTHTIETWYNSGEGNPPFDRVQGGIMQVGLGAGYSVSSNDNYLYFLGDDLIVYRVLSLQSDPVSTIPMNNEFFEYDRTHDAIGFCFTFQKQNFYFLTFPSEQKTWIYNEDSGIWSQMTSGLAEGAHIATSYIYHYGRHLIADGGNVLEWSPDALTDDGEIIIRERCTANMAAELLGPQFAGLPVTWNYIDLILDCEAPEGAPVMMMTYSDDGGYTWSNERLLQLGQAGSYIWRVRATQLGQSVERVYKFRVSDPVRCTIQRASADVDIGLG